MANPGRRRAVERSPRGARFAAPKSGVCGRSLRPERDRPRRLTDTDTPTRADTREKVDQQRVESRQDCPRAHGLASPTSTFYFLTFYSLGGFARRGRMARAASSALARRVRLEDPAGRTRGKRTLDSLTCHPAPRQQLDPSSPTGVAWRRPYQYNPYVQRSRTVLTEYVPRSRIVLTGRRAASPVRHHHARDPTAAGAHRLDHRGRRRLVAYGYYRAISPIAQLSIHVAPRPAPVASHREPRRTLAA